MPQAERDKDANVSEAELRVDIGKMCFDKIRAVVDDDCSDDLIASSSSELTERIIERVLRGIR